MLRGVFILLDEYKKVPYLAEFMNRLERSGVKAVLITEANHAGKELLQAVNRHIWKKSDCIIITDRRSFIEEVGEDMICIGFSETETDISELGDVKYVLMGLEEVSVKYIRDIHTRLLGEPVTIVETERLRIRESTEEDMEVFYTFQEESGIMKDIPMLTEESFADLQEYRAYQYGMFGYGIWTVELRESGEVIGRAGFEDRETEDGAVPELGYMIGEAYRGNGYATEACFAILAHAQKEWAIYKFIAFVRRSNAASVRVLQKTGFHFVKPAVRRRKAYLLYERNMEAYRSDM